MKTIHINLVPTLTLMFVILRLSGYIDWSWWWVFSPFWIPPVIGIALYLLLAFIGGAIFMVAEVFEHMGKGHNLF